MKGLVSNLLHSKPDLHFAAEPSLQNLAVFVVSFFWQAFNSFLLSGWQHFAPRGRGPRGQARPPGPASPIWRIRRARCGSAYNAGSVGA